ncbi:MAG: hypothetical protein ACRBB0_06290 [Pelagimonas sp.]|uniref:hypothetical protein n=1 Tax=Pelagimonas sp. TaxID=2073170 RepID=UPI003D6A432C
MGNVMSYMIAICIGLLASLIVAYGRAPYGDVVLLAFAFPAFWYVWDFTKTLQNPDVQGTWLDRRWEASKRPGAICFMSAVLFTIAISTSLAK